MQEVKWNGDDIVTLKQMSYFVEIVKQNSFTKAAERLYVSQSALSKSIRTLEEELDAELINRSAKELQLTPAGKIFYDYAIDILNYYHTQSAALSKRLHGTNKSLNIGLPPTAGTIFFSSLLYQFREKYPELELNITETTSKEVKNLVENGGLDLGVVIEPFKDDKFLSRKVYSSEAVLAVSKGHPLASKRSVNAVQLQDEHMLIVSQDYMFHDVVLNYCKSAGFTPKIVFESSQWDLLLEMVASGQGVSILPKPIIDKCYNARVHQIRLKKPEFPWTLTLIYLKNRSIARAAECFLDLCTEI